MAGGKRQGDVQKGQAPNAQVVLGIKVCLQGLSLPTVKAAVKDQNFGNVDKPFGGKELCHQNEWAAGLRGNVRRYRRHELPIFVNNDVSSVKGNFVQYPARKLAHDTNGTTTNILAGDRPSGNALSPLASATDAAILQLRGLALFAAVQHNNSAGSVPRRNVRARAR